MNHKTFYPTGIFVIHWREEILVEPLCIRQIPNNMDQNPIYLIL